MLAQVLAIIIFLAMFLLIILEIWERQWITLACGLLTLLLVFGLGMHSMGAIMRTLNLQSFFTTGFWYAAGESSEASSGINWQTIIFIAGMMIMVEGMAKVGFFRWLCMEIAKMVKYQVILIFMTFMLLSFVLAMFIDSITVILFLAAVTIELSQLLEFDPVPMILSEIFCANLGGSATMCGDPPNIIIGTSLGYSFTDFITNTGLMAVVSLVFVVIYFYFAFRKELKKNGANKKDHASYPDPKEAITDKRGFTASCIIFLCAVVLLVSHAQTGLTVSTIGVAIAIVTLIVAGKDALELLKKVDYKTLLFFVGLFVVVSGLEETGVLEILAGFIGSVSGGNIAVMIAIIIIVSAVASAFIDNIPFAATMIPVITDLASDVAGVNLTVLAWALAIGTDIGGSATPIGASANVVGIATAAREGHIIKWGKYCKYMAPATIIVVAISLAMIYVRYL
ncbi:citrate transporter [Faecalicatena fissicatena]|uniref:SLC13 family permease n=1 Tax=Faecalicatena fissicatena TaxID=290055 RepID=UPI00156F25EA|nr:SLC13 family permease [Faecalicatena fissicatena]NSD82427.1 citrate transporter [Faecalicatena fissicatena]